MGTRLASHSLVAFDIKLNSWPFLAPGREGITQMVELIATAFSNYRLTIEDVIAENDRVAVRLTETGVHTGPLLGMPASGNTFSNSMIHILRITDGTVVEHWREVDMQKLLSQLSTDA